MKAALAVILTGALVLGGAVVYAYELSRARAFEAHRLTSGDPARGAALMIRFGCAGCHTASGSPGAQGRVGPPLNDLKSRSYIGRSLQHTPENLVRWIADPRSIDPRSAMPRTGVSEAQARDIAAHLYAQP